MSDTKISQLTSGNPAQAGDVIPIERGGVNFSITAGSLAQLPPVIEDVDLVGQTASTGATLLAAGAAGMYRVNLDLICTTAGSAGAVYATITWNNGTTSESLLTALLPLAAQGELSAQMGVFYLGAGQNITWSTTVEGVSGTPQYALHIRLEYLG